jgi:hypothetical protein
MVVSAIKKKIGFLNKEILEGAIVKEDWKLCDGLELNTLFGWTTIAVPLPVELLEGRDRSLPGFVLRECPIASWWSDVCDLWDGAEFDRCPSPGGNLP